MLCRLKLLLRSNGYQHFINSKKHTWRVVCITSLNKAPKYIRKGGNLIGFPSFTTTSIYSSTHKHEKMKENPDSNVVLLKISPPVSSVWETYKSFNFYFSHWIHKGRFRSCLRIPRPFEIWIFISYQLISLISMHFFTTADVYVLKSGGQLNCYWAFVTQVVVVKSSSCYLDSYRYYYCFFNVVLGTSWC